MRGQYLITSMILKLGKVDAIFSNFFTKFISLTNKYNLHKKPLYIESNNDKEIIE